MYHHIMEMSNNHSLRQRVMGCAAVENHPDPFGFVERNMIKVCKGSDWMLAWEQAQRQMDNPKYNPDIGARTDVVTDEMILSAVQPLVQAEVPPDGMRMLQHNEPGVPPKPQIMVPAGDPATVRPGAAVQFVPVDDEGQALPTDGPIKP
jgi:hypothetical protein